MMSAALVIAIIIITHWHTLNVQYTLRDRTEFIANVNLIELLKRTKQKINEEWQVKYAFV